VLLKGCQKGVAEVEILSTSAAGSLIGLDFKINEVYNLNNN
jgi:hypothetical protein